MVRRPLAPGELDHELIWLAISIGALVLGAGWIRAGLPWPQCLFHKWTGHPCVTCGATRATIALFHGNIGESFNFNPLVFVALLALGVYDIYAAAVLVLRKPRLRIAKLNRRARIVLRALALSLLAANWLFLLQRGIV